MPKIVPFEQKRKWLQRYDQGETEASIARAERRDLRTVTKGIQEARVERDLSAARGSVLTKAIEAHYADLLKEAERVRSVITTAISASDLEKKTRSTRNVEEALGISEAIFPVSGRDRRMTDALVEHLGRPFQKRLEDHERLQDMIREQAQVFQNKLSVEAKKRLHKALGYEVDVRGVALSGIGIILHKLQYRQKLVKADEIIEEWKYRCEGGSAKGTFAVQWGDKIDSYRLIDGLRTEKDLDKIVPVHKDILVEVLRWDETVSLRGLIEQRAEVAEQLEDELETLQLQHILPGRCRYCPGSSAFGAKPRRRVK